ncbi:uncharacterized protein LOC133177190 [Saccostrea echinata]|uniref:uncharacterized protein LOC133177190 n=1 Tax=Saccostrea echinata TaxID=191078 RepID=UPI002A8032AC|nr:uncharacterized protein LOC133177190 [Saccostrea echinata]
MEGISEPPKDQRNSSDKGDTDIYENTADSKNVKENIAEEGKCNIESRKSIEDQEKSITEQKKSIKDLEKIIKDQERNISQQEEITEQLQQSIKQHEENIKEQKTLMEPRWNIIENEKESTKEKEIDTKKKSTKSGDGENEMEIRNKEEKRIEEEKKVIEKHEKIIGEQKRCVKELEESIQKQKESIEEIKIYIAVQGENIKEQEQNEIIEKQKRLLENLDKVIEERNKIIEELNRFREDLMKVIKEQNTKIDELKKIILEQGDVIAAFLVSWSDLIKRSKPCERGEALKMLDVNYSCQYEEDKRKLESILRIGISSLALDSFFLSGCLIFCLTLPVLRRKGLMTLYSLFAVVAVVFCGLLLNEYLVISRIKAVQKTTDYHKLRKDMLESLQQNYRSDILNSSDVISNSWNSFFIKYDCCAVKQVTSTTNDFDTTPWCTTSGSCQQTNSQIPKTCCRDVTEDDYMNAPDSCHATVTAGTYKESCFIRIKSLSDDGMQECELDALCTYVFTLGISKLAAFVLSIVTVLIRFDGKKRKKNHLQTYTENKMSIGKIVSNG